MFGISDIPSFQTLSRRARSFDLHIMHREIVFLHSMKEIAAVDSYMIHTCKYSTAMKRNYLGNYRYPYSEWSKTMKGWSYGRKCQMTLDIDSLIIMEWKITKGNVHDSSVSHDMIDSVIYFLYIIADSVYDTFNIYDYVFENTHCIPVIDTNKRRGIVTDRLTVNRRIGIDFRREYTSLYSLRWEIEKIFSILGEILQCENIWYVKDKDYDTAMGLKAIAYNLMIVSNIETGNKPREIMKIVSC